MNMTWMFSFFTPLQQPFFQVMSTTNEFFMWYFYGLSGLGGWVIFLLLALVAFFWLIYDSQSRRLPAIGWRIGVLSMLIFLVPTLLYRFTVNKLHTMVYDMIKIYGATSDNTLSLLTNQFSELKTFSSIDQVLNSFLPPLTAYGEVVFYLGILGGVLAPILCVGYFVTYKGMAGCPQGHVYDDILGQCPECQSMRAPAIDSGFRYAQPGVYSPQPPSVSTPAVSSSMANKPSKPKLNYAWFVDLTHNHQLPLYEGTTTIGRSSRNDVVVDDDAISKEHIKIVESNGHCTIIDVGSKFGSLVNGKRLRAQRTLQNEDEVVLGDTKLKFITTR